MSTVRGESPATELSDVTLMALSWDSPRTFQRSIRSWRPLLDRGARGVVWFQNISDEDRAIARDGGFEAIGSRDNIGIGPAYRALLEHATTEFALFLECDWRLTNPDAAHQLGAARSLLLDGVADLVRLRSRRKPGWPINPARFQNREMDYPAWLLDVTYWEPRPDRIFPGEIRRLVRERGEWFLASSPFANWTNNPHLARTEFLAKHVVQFCYGSGLALEGLIDEYWQRGQFRVAQGEGLFTHDRIDGPSYRPQPWWKRLAYMPRLRLRRYLRPFTSQTA